MDSGTSLHWSEAELYYYLCLTSRKLLNLSGLPFFFLQNGDSSTTYFMRLLGGPNESIYVNCL